MRKEAPPETAEEWLARHRCPWCRNNGTCKGYKVAPKPFNEWRCFGYRSGPKWM